MQSLISLDEVCLNCTVSQSDHELQRTGKAGLSPSGLATRKLTASVLLAAPPANFLSPPTPAPTPFGSRGTAGLLFQVNLNPNLYIF